MPIAQSKIALYETSWPSLNVREGTNLSTTKNDCWEKNPLYAFRERYYRFHTLPHRRNWCAISLCPTNINFIDDLPLALDFRAWIGGEAKIFEYCHNLAIEGGKRMAEILGTRVMDPNGEFTLNMVNIHHSHACTLPCDCCWFMMFHRSTWNYHCQVVYFGLRKWRQCWTKRCWTKETHSRLIFIITESGGLGVVHRFITRYVYNVLINFLLFQLFVLVP